MHGEDYLIVDPACEMSERGARDKNDGNEVVDNCDLSLDLELTERVAGDDETLPYVEEDLECPESDMEFEPESEQMHEEELTNLRVLEWLHVLQADPKETILKIQDVDQNSIKYISHDNTESNSVVPEGPLHVPESILDLLDLGRSTQTSMAIFVRGVGVGLTHAENLMIKNLKLARETVELETEGKKA